VGDISHRGTFAKNEISEVDLERTTTKQQEEEEE
jgi:hypothetical protein